MKTCWCGCLEAKHLDEALKIEAQLHGTTPEERRKRLSKKKPVTVL